MFEIKLAKAANSLHKAVVKYAMDSLNRRSEANISKSNYRHVRLEARRTELEEAGSQVDTLRKAAIERAEANAQAEYHRIATELTFVEAQTDAVERDTREQENQIVKAYQELRSIQASLAD